MNTINSKRKASKVIIIGKEHMKAKKTQIAANQKRVHKCIGKNLKDPTLLWK